MLALSDCEMNAKTFFTCVCVCVCVCMLYALVFFLWRCGRILEVSQSHPTALDTSLNEWSARHRDLCVTTHNSHNRQTFMRPAGLDPTTSPGERPQTHILDHAATRLTCLCVCVISLLNSFGKALCIFVHFVLTAWLCNDVTANLAVCGDSTAVCRADGQHANAYCVRVTNCSYSTVLCGRCLTA
jgi:hypothetical protein